MTDTEKLIKTLDARYAAGQIGFQEGVSALANHDALKTAQRLALALAAIEAASEALHIRDLLADDHAGLTEDEVVTLGARAFELTANVRNIRKQLEAAK